jgi:hypothetical protein
MHHYMFIYGSYISRKQVSKGLLCQNRNQPERGAEASGSDFPLIFPYTSEKTLDAAR